MSVAVVIPTYKETLNAYERISLEQCMRVLGDYDIFFVMPKNLNVSRYHDSRIRRIEFDEKFFSSIAAYNRLMLSDFVYRELQSYEYILIYQLDGFVFSDRLGEFISIGYDYIGAPWLKGVKLYKYNMRGIGRINRFLNDALVSDVVYVGNGGVSLRKTSSFLNLLQQYRNLADNWNGNEDVFFSKMGSRHPDMFRVASIEDAVDFAFETDVEKCWKLNNMKLPFACHAWEKWDIAFWRDVFFQYGYEI